MRRTTLRRLPNIGHLFDGAHSDAALYRFLQAYERTTLDEAISKQPLTSNIIVWVNDIWGTHRSPEAVHKMQNLGGLRSLTRANVFDLKPRQRKSFMRALNGESNLSIDGIYKHKKKNKFAIVVHQPNDYSMHAVFGATGAAAGAGLIAGTTALMKLIDSKLGEDNYRKESLKVLDWPVAHILEFKDVQLKELENEWVNFQNFTEPTKFAAPIPNDLLNNYESYHEFKELYNYRFRKSIKHGLDDKYPTLHYLHEMLV